MKKEEIKKVGQVIFILMVMLYIFFSVWTQIVLTKQIRAKNEQIRESLTKIDKLTKELSNEIESSCEKTIKSIGRLEESYLKEIKNINKILQTKNCGMNIRLKKVSESQDKENNGSQAKDIKLIYAEGVLEAKEAEGYDLLKEKKYEAAYKIFKGIVEVDPERLPSRYYEMYSKFYRNPMDKANYKDILEKIKYLREKGMIEDSFEIIEDFIKREEELNKDEP